MTTLLERRGAVSPANLSLSYRRPLEFVRGEKHFLYTADGRQFLDAYNNVPHVGHAHPHIVDAVHQQMATLNTNTRYLQAIHVSYAERLLRRLPSHLTRILFTNSASEANELALRLARVATGRTDTLVMDHGYHGGTTGAMAISPYKFRDKPSAYRQPDWVHVVDQPDPYRGTFRGENVATSYLNALQHQIDILVDQGRPPAAFFSECLPSVGGQLVLPAGYLNGAYNIVKSAGGVCVADDVQTGLGRLGHWFWGFDQQQAQPDLVVLGKPIGNGFPLAAVAMTDEIAHRFSNGPEFFSTFGGSSAACAAGNAVLDVLENEPLIANAARVGDYLLSALKTMAGTIESIGDVRGSGFFLGVDLVTSRETRAPDAELAEKTVNSLRDQQILIGVDGPHHNVLKIRPPMTFDQAAAEQLIAALEKTLKRLSNGAARQA